MFLLKANLTLTPQTIYARREKLYALSEEKP
jgi:hypothetical protein